MHLLVLTVLGWKGSIHWALRININVLDAREQSVLLASTDERILHLEQEESIIRRMY
jgi:hypothetical protein